MTDEGPVYYCTLPCSRKHVQDSGQSWGCSTSEMDELVICCSNLGLSSHHRYPSPPNLSSFRHSSFKLHHPPASPSSLR